MTRLVPLVAGLLALLALAPSAMAATRGQIIRDCADDGQLQGDYTQSELRDARKNLPSDVAEYTDCADVLHRAELPSGGGDDGDPAATGAAAASGGGGGPLLTPETDADRAALDDAGRGGNAPVRIDGQDVVPGASGLGPAANANDIPGTLLAALILLAVGGAALALPGVRRHVPSLPRLRRS